MEQLYRENAGLIHSLARRYAGACKRDRGLDPEDLEQAGFLGLIQAQRTWRADGGCSWGTWAAQYVKREFANALGYRNGHFTKAHSGAVSLDEPLEDGPGESRLDLLADPNNPAADEALLLSDLQKTVREAVERLSDGRQREAVQMCELNGKPLREAAGALSVSPERVRQLIHKAKLKLAHDKRLRALADLELRTAYHHRRGLSTFRITGTSDVEATVMWREAQRAKLEAQYRRLLEDDTVYDTGAKADGARQKQCNTVEDACTAAGGTGQGTEAAAAQG